MHVNIIYLAFEGQINMLHNKTYINISKREVSHRKSRRMVIEILLLQEQASVMVVERFFFQKLSSSMQGPVFKESKQ